MAHDQTIGVGNGMLLERSEPMMGTQIGVHVAVSEGRESAARAAMDACFDWLHEVDRRLTRFDPTSELCRLNAHPGEWVLVSDLLYTALAESLAAARATGGLFDPALLPALERLGYDRDILQIPRDDAAEGAPLPLPPETSQSGGAWRGIEVDPASRRVKLPLGARLDLGGIAKGWAADAALDRYFAAFDGVLIDVGSDMRAHGRNAAGEPWALGVRDPRSGGDDPERHSAVFSLAAGGVACSGALDRWWRRGGARRHHLIDPRTGQPMRLWLDKADDDFGAGDLVATVTALAPTGARAEVAAKVALLRGYPAALAAVEAAWEGDAPHAAPYGDAETALIVVMGDGTLYCSKNLREWLATCGGGGELWLD
jgi:thiamine biosynthesis lipoprotein